MSTERILVNAKVADQFRQVLAGTIDAVFPDKNGLVMIDKAPVTKNASLVQDAVSKGAKAIYGDPSDKRELATAMRPVVIEGVKDGMDMYYQESFGPTVSLFIVENDEEAIKIANDTDYGLASSVFTENLQRGLKIAKQIETGAVHINSMSVHDEASLPHGGAKKSGFGRFNGEEGLKEWVRLKVNIAVTTSRTLANITDRPSHGRTDTLLWNAFSPLASHADLKIPMHFEPQYSVHVSTFVAYTSKTTACI